MHIEVNGVRITDLRMDPTGCVPVDPTYYTTVVRDELERELRRPYYDEHGGRVNAYGPNMPVVDLGDRESLIRWMGWNDRNGCFIDEDCVSEGLQPFTLHEAQDLFWRIITDD